MAKATTKRVMLDKANLTIVIVVAVASFVTIFSLAASKSLFSQLGYQNRVIAKKDTAKKQLVASVSARDDLVEQYQLFASNQTNIIAGSLSGTSDRDGDNAKIVLDALPSKYDFPALATSLEKLITSNSLAIASITGVDDELNQSGQNGQMPVDMPFSLSFTGAATNTQNFMSSLERSIRPIQVQKVTLTGSDSALTTSITASTYYQPAKKFEVKKETVK